MKLLFDDAERVGDWVSQEIGIPGFVPPYSGVGWLNDEGDMVGGVVFNNFTGPNVEASVAWTGVLTRSVLRIIRQYVFEQHPCRRITIHTRASNAGVIDQARRLGFKPEGVHPAYFADDDGVSLGLLKDDCKW